MAFLSGLTSLATSSPTVLAVGAGVLAGAVTGTAVVASGVLSNPPPQQLALVSCPASESVVARVSSGQSILVMAKSGDGAWLQLYIGEPGVDSGWAPASALRIAESVDNLPVAGCEVAAAPSGAPTPQVTAIVLPTPTPTPLPSGVTPPPPTPTPIPTPTPKPTPTPTPLPPGVTPTPFVPTPLPPPPTPPPPTPPPPTAPPPTAPPPTPETTKPSLSNLTTTGGYYGGNGDYYIYGPSSLSFCPYPSATMRVSASDASGIASITLYYWPGNSGQLSKPMNLSAGSVTNGEWTTSFSAADSWADAAFNQDPAGLISYWVVATDAVGNQQTLNHSNSYRLYSGTCFG